jgi:hypothetical protein
MFLGDQTVASRYNQVLRDGIDPPILPARIGEAVPAASYLIDPLNYAHPIAAAFRDHQTAGLLTTPISKYWKLESDVEGRAFTPVLGLSSGDPLAVAGSSGRGRVLLAATAASLASVDVQSGRPWTAMPTWPSFLPLVREMLAWSVGWRIEGANVLVGESISGPLSLADSRRPLAIRAPDGARLAHQVQWTGERAQWSYGPTEFSGMYVASIADTRGDSQAAFPSK